MIRSAHHSNPPSQERSIFPTIRCAGERHQRHGARCETLCPHHLHSTGRFLSKQKETRLFSTQKSNNVPPAFLLVLATRGNSLRRGRVYSRFIHQLHFTSLAPSSTPSLASQSQKLATEQAKLSVLNSKLFKEKTERAAESREAVSRSSLASISVAGQEHPSTLIRA